MSSFQWRFEIHLEKIVVECCLHLFFDPPQFILFCLKVSFRFMTVSSHSKSNFSTSKLLLNVQKKKKKKLLPWISPLQYVFRLGFFKIYMYKWRIKLEGVPWKTFWILRTINVWMIPLSSFYQTISWCQYDSAIP